MIWKAGAAMGAILPVVAAAAAKGGATVATSTPAIWHFLGYPFEAAGMIAALFGCLSARFWIGAAQSVRQEHRWSLDIPVSGMALAVSAALVISHRTEPLGGLMYGAGLGILGEGIFKIAESQLRKVGLIGAEPDKAD
ncbi:hypothetical protein KCP91_08110 [Microvirga sp. SRT01]|uniref:Holin n=1 Tax=Sphingomonas longa TaxID=2778730 RepID=A0ABS2D5X5_9SPHN|nr:MULTISPECIES: hypothetical protein [Alphaproteobacteria]MBM6576334.1 hypothetical protein [Sphingomonas sp. BT552]MBR7709380.1 hypothetical protein [Microvirga sp. SRT01]